MKTKLRIRRGFTLVELLVVIVIIAALAGLTAPMILKQGRKADLAEATSNARQIGMALFAFQSDYTTYPGPNTESDVDNAGGFNIASATSNGCFGQLFAAGLTESEAMFYAKVKGSSKPDGNISGEKALAEGECGYGYILGQDGDGGSSGLSSAGNPSRILAVCPLEAEATTFDLEPFDKKAVLLRIDNSVTTSPIVDKKAMSSTKADAVDLLVGGSKDSIWGEDLEPKVVPPIKK